MQKKNNKKKILGIMSKLGNFINKSQPVVGEFPPQQEIDENTPKEPKQKKAEKNFNLQIEDDEKAEYDLNDDDDEEEEEEEDDDNEEKAKEDEKENIEESTNDNDSSIEKKEEEKNEGKEEKKVEKKKEEIREEKKVEEKKEEVKEEKKEDKEKPKEDDKTEKENKEIKNEEKKNIKAEENQDVKQEEKKEKEEKKEEKKIEDKKDDKKEDKKDDKKDVKKEDKIEDKKEVKKVKDESKKKVENNQKQKKENKNVNKPISKTHQTKKDQEKKPAPKKEENEIKPKPTTPTPTKKEKPRIKFQKKPKVSDNNKICHAFLKKGTDIDIKEYEFYTIKKIKKEKTILSKLNNLGINLNLNIKLGGINKVGNKLNSFFKKKTKETKKNYTDYYLIINEHFIYFCKDAEVFVDEPDKRRIGSSVPLNNIKKINIEKEGEYYKICFEIKFRTLDKIKEFYADNEVYDELLEIFHEFKKEYNLGYNIEIK